MNIQNIFANGLPEELANLTLGQVVIFSSPEEGMSEQNIRISQYVQSVTNHITKNCGIMVDKPAVFVLPTENTYLWDIIACKVLTPQTPIVELADLGSLTEMLYDYWGLDFDSVAKPNIPKRFIQYHIFIGDYHPSKVCIEPIKAITTASTSSEIVADTDAYDLGTMSIDFIYAKGKEPTKNDICKKIQKILWEADMYDVEIDYEKILKAFDKDKKKSYTLDFDIELNKEGNATKCDLFLLDEKEEKHIVKLEAQEMATYLTFMLYENGEGFKMTDFDYPNKETTKAFIDLFSKIHKKMLKRNEFDLDEMKMKYRKIIGEIRCRIKNKISKITMNPKYLQAFTIEGEKEGLYKIEASTEEIREKIKDKLHLQ